MKKVLLLLLFVIPNLAFADRIDDAYDLLKADMASRGIILLDILRRGHSAKLIVAQQYIMNYPAGKALVVDPNGRTFDRFIVAFALNKGYGY